MNVSEKVVNVSEKVVNVSEKVVNVSEKVVNVSEKVENVSENVVKDKDLPFTPKNKCWERSKYLFWGVNGNLSKS